MFKLRVYQAGDQDAVLALWAGCGSVSSDGDALGDIQRKLAVQPELLLVGTLNSEDDRIRHGRLRWEPRLPVYLAVASDHQRMGYGRTVVARLQELLSERGCPKLNLFVEVDNESGFAFYESFGFTRNGMVSMGRSRGVGRLPDRA